MYVSPGNGSAVRMNANLLLIHAVAARAGHDGAARQDARARALLETLTRAPSSVLAAGEDTSDPTRSVCWTRDLASHRRDHRSLGPAGRRGARAGPGARGARSACPGALAARVAGGDRPLRPAPRLALPARRRQPVQLERAALRGRGRRDRAPRPAARRLPPLPAPLRARAIRRPRRGMAAAEPRARATGSATRPASRPAHALNFDTPEYANIVVVRPALPRARPAGGHAAAAGRATGGCCAPGSRACSPASWTHAGYLNWDTGYGAGRWHSGQYWAFAQQGLLASPAAPGALGEPRLRRAGRRRCSTAACCSTTAGRARPARRSRRGWSFGVFSRAPRLQPLRDAHGRERRCAPSRAGLGAMPAEDPPPLYAFDPDTERLAVTTPRYSTAIVPDNRGAFDYGGIDLARLLRPRPARRRRRSAASRRTRSGWSCATPPGARCSPPSTRACGAGACASCDSPHGRARHPRPYAASPPAGPFERLESRGSRAARRPAHLHAPPCSGPTGSTPPGASPARGRCGPWDVELDLPTWGAGAAIDVVRTRRHAGSASPGRAPTRPPWSPCATCAASSSASATAPATPRRPRGGTDRGVLAVTAGRAAAHGARPGADARAAPARRARRCASSSSSLRLAPGV